MMKTKGFFFTSLLAKVDILSLFFCLFVSERESETNRYPSVANVDVKSKLTSYPNILF